MFKSYLKALYQCFFNPELYRLVVYRWKRASGIGFASIVVVIFSIITAIQFVSDMPPIVDKFMNHAAISAPKSYIIKDGELTIDKPLPYIVTFKQLVPPDIMDEMEAKDKDSSDESSDKKISRDKKLDKPFIVFKDSVSIDEIEDYPDGVVLVGKKKIITSKKNGEIKIHSFRNIKHFAFYLQNYLPFHVDTVLGMYRYVVAAFLWLFFFAGMWITFVIKAFIVAVLSYLPTLFISEKSLIFNDRFRIAIFALAPVYIITQIIGQFELVIGFWTIEFVALLYFTAYIVVAKQTKALLGDESQ